MALPIARGWNEVILRVPSKLNRSMILFLLNFLPPGWFWFTCCWHLRRNPLFAGKKICFLIKTLFLSKGKGEFCNCYYYYIPAHLWMCSRGDGLWNQQGEDSSHLEELKLTKARTHYVKFLFTYVWPFFPFLFISLIFLLWLLSQNDSKLWQRSWFSRLPKWLPTLINK